jgi:glutamyl-tRNA reductase
VTLLAIGLNHRTAPVAVLERAALVGDDRAKVLHDLVNGEHVTSAALLATCNRVELYVESTTFHGGVVEVSEQLARASGVPFEELREHLYVHHEAAVLQHLFSVACGLDSVVVGEAQVLGQLRDSVGEAQQEGTLGRTLGEVLTTALRVGKRARTDTAIDRAGASVVSVGLQLATEALGTLEGRSVLVVGAGSTGALAGASLRRAGVGPITVANRTAERAARLAENLGGRAVGLHDLVDEIAAADLLVSSTAATGLVLGLDDVAAAVERRGGRPLVVLDLALPRDIDPAVRTLPGVTLVDLETLSAARATAAVEADVAAVRGIVAEEVTAFIEAQRATQVAPTVVALRTQAAGIVADELGRLLGRVDLDDRSRLEVENTVRRVADKLLHAPTVRVKELARRSGGDSYAAALRELFDLPREAVDSVSATPDEGLTADGVPNLPRPAGGGA